MDYYYVIKNSSGDYYKGKGVYGPRAEAVTYNLDAICSALDRKLTIECYVDKRVAPLTTPIFFLASQNEANCAKLLEYAGASECLQGFLASLRSLRIIDIAHCVAQPLIIKMFNVVYSFDPPDCVEGSCGMLYKMLDRIRALNTALAPVDNDDVVSLTVDSVKQLLYEPDQESLYNTIREVYRFRGSISHFVKVPRLLLEELYFVVTKREASPVVSSEELVSEIAVVSGCYKEKIERDVDAQAFAERLRTVRTMAGISQEEFAQLCAIDKATYLAIEKGDIQPTTPDMTAILSAILKVSSAS